MCLTQNCLTTFVCCHGKESENSCASVWMCKGACGFNQQAECIISSPPQFRNWIAVFPQRETMYLLYFSVHASFLSNGKREQELLLFFFQQWLVFLSVCLGTLGLRGHSP